MHFSESIPDSWIEEFPYDRWLGRLEKIVFGSSELLCLSVRAGIISQRVSFPTSFLIYRRL